MPLVRREDSKSGKGRHVYLNEEGAAFFEAQTADRWRAEQARRHVPSFDAGGAETASGRVIPFGSAGASGATSPSR